MDVLLQLTPLHDDQDLTIATIEKRDEVEKELDGEIERELDAEEAVDSFKEESKTFRAGP